MQEFLVLVDKMRTAQKEYFKFKTKTDLKRSIALEAKVDEQLKKLANENYFKKTDYANTEQLHFTEWLAK